MAADETFAHPKQKARVLNNFVTEQLLVENVSRDGTHVFALESPREGWLFFRTQAWTGRAGRMTIGIRSEGDWNKPALVIAYGPGEKKTVEAMRYVPKGTCTLLVGLNDVELSSLTVRTIPAIIFADFPCTPHLPRFGRYDWAWLKQIGMLDNCNTLISRGRCHFMTEWLLRGRQVLERSGVPGLHSKDPVTEQSAYEYWMAKRGLQHPCMSGVFASDFHAGAGRHFPGWIGAIKRVRKNKPDKVFYPWMDGTADGMRSFVEPLLDTDCRFGYGRYLCEQPTEAAAEKLIKGKLVDEMVAFNRYAPGFAERCIYGLVFVSAPSESTNKYPEANFKVFLDMQIHTIATDPAFVGAYGIEEYLASYCDEEYLRWCVKLFRHYCIEGSSERLSKDPYALNHIRNPDFEKGLDGWKVEPAGSGTIQAKTMKGYGWLQGRYPRDSKGDTFLWMKRNAHKPNTVTQEIVNLQPGRYYSVKMYTGDFGDLTKWQRHEVALRVEDANPVPEENYQSVYHNNSTHLLPRYGKTKTFFNYHRVVFRATSSTAKLTISDWRSPERTRGPIGQETMFNFIEVEPYLMPDAFAE